MNRTTEKYTHYEEYMSNVPEEAHHAINAVIYEELYKLEDIEEELGIELEVLFSALKNGVYCFANQEQLIHDYVWLANHYVTAGIPTKIYFSLKTFYDGQTLSVEDYGKTWALSREELENENQNKTN